MWFQSHRSFGKLWVEEKKKENMTLEMIKSVGEKEKKMTLEAVE